MLKTITPTTVPMLIKFLGMEFPTIKSKQKRLYGLYKCSCGKEFRAIIDNVKYGSTKSCGCYKNNIRITHGLSRSKFQYVWKGILSRTLNKKNSYYHNYGGRGITVCERWMIFENFIEDMYPTYQDGLTIDRKNNDGNYEPSNCRWSTKEVQARNSRILRSTNTSGYRGVSMIKKNNTWLAQIIVNKINIRLGAFNTAIEAAIAYDTYVIENNLEHTINGVLNGN